MFFFSRACAELLSAASKRARAAEVEGPDAWKRQRYHVNKRFLTGTVASAIRNNKMKKN